MKTRSITFVLVAAGCGLLFSRPAAAEDCRPLLDALYNDAAAGWGIKVTAVSVSTREPDFQFHTFGADMDFHVTKPMEGQSSVELDSFILTKDSGPVVNGEFLQIFAGRQNQTTEDSLLELRPGGKLTFVSISGNFQYVLDKLSCERAGSHNRVVVRSRNSWSGYGSDSWQLVMARKSLQ